MTSRSVRPRHGQGGGGLIGDEAVDPRSARPPAPSDATKSTPKNVSRGRKSQRRRTSSRLRRRVANTGSALASNRPNTTTTGTARRAPRIQPCERSAAMRPARWAVRRMASPRKRTAAESGARTMNDPPIRSLRPSSASFDVTASSTTSARAVQPCNVPLAVRAVTPAIATPRVAARASAGETPAPPAAHSRSPIMATVAHTTVLTPQAPSKSTHAPSVAETSAESQSTTRASKGPPSPWRLGARAARLGRVIASPRAVAGPPGRARRSVARAGGSRAPRR